MDFASSVIIIAGFHLYVNRNIYATSVAGAAATSLGDGRVPDYRCRWIHGRDCDLIQL